MRFTSDNIATVHPAIFEALAAANAPDAGYDGDALSRGLDAAFSELFDTEVAALWIATGTAANGLALAALCPPHGGVICHDLAHINCDEAGAPEFYTHGAKLIGLEGEGAKLTPQAIAARLDAIPADVHRVHPAVISITNATEYGRVYTPAETAAIGDLAKARGLGLHVDGARFANAVAYLGCHPADLTWKAGVDALSFGFIKNGGMSAEALILFRRDLADLVHVRRKRAGHLGSKGRFQAAQIHALLGEGRWLANAVAANRAAAAIAAAAGDRLFQPVEANELFVRMSADEAARLRAQGFSFYDWSAGLARFVTNWDQPAAEVSALAAALAAL